MNSGDWFLLSQGEIDAHEDSFRVTDEAGQTLVNTGHYAFEEVKEKVGLLLDCTAMQCIQRCIH